MNIKHSHTHSRCIHSAPAAQNSLKGTAPLCHLGHETVGEGGKRVRKRGREMSRQRERVERRERGREEGGI